MTEYTGKRVRHSMTLAERLEFYSIPEPNSGCTLWTGHSLPPPREYGYLYWEGELRGAHVLAWEVANGRKVPDGMDVRHRCDMPPCINDAHLVLGTRQQNMQDMIVRKRSPRGRARPNAKLTEEAVRDIRRSTETLATLAARYGVGLMTVSMARRGVTWAHVQGPGNENGCT